MDLFKNGVGRPSNETLKKRRNVVISIALLVVIAIGICVYAFSSNTTLLKGAASKNVTFKYSNSRACVSGNAFDGNIVNCDSVGGKMSNQSKSITSDPTIAKNQFKNPGYDFVGWIVVRSNSNDNNYLCKDEKGKAAWGTVGCASKVYLSNEAKISKSLLEGGKTYTFYAVWKGKSNYDLDADGNVTELDAKIALKNSAELASSYPGMTSEHARKILQVARGVAVADSNNNATGQTIGTAFIRGDIDGDGKVTVTDARRILQVAIKNVSAPSDKKEKKKYDLNMDNDIDATDARMALQIADGNVVAGDVDGDGKVTEDDAYEALENGAKLKNSLSSDPRKFAAADMNSDGIVDVNDARLILRRANGLD